MERLAEYSALPSEDAPPPGIPASPRPRIPGGASAAAAGASAAAGEASAAAEQQRSGGAGPGIEREPPPGWPSQGALVFEAAVARYPAAAARCLDGVTFSCAPGRRTGLCGRSGAGKSSAVLAALRALPLEGGSIAIDGVDVATVRRSALRSAVATVPQARALSNNNDIVTIL